MGICHGRVLTENSPSGKGPSLAIYRTLHSRIKAWPLTLFKILMWIKVNTGKVKFTSAFVFFSFGGVKHMTKLGHQGL